VSAGEASGAAVHLLVRDDADVAVARQAARAVARDVGFARSATEAIATAVSEIARNLHVHARRGEIAIRPVAEGGRAGIEVVARDEAPGIADVERAMQDGYSTAGGLGLGLSGAKRLMDFFALESRLGAGTTVTMKKWLHGTRE
jgi:serine/threonine-protein kinase RsbT